MSVFREIIHWKTLTVDMFKHTVFPIMTVVYCVLPLKLYI